MIVNKGDGVNTAAIAQWLDFLRRARGVSVAELAKAHGMRRSNLTTFINSGGKPGAVARAKVHKALVGMGLHADGTLCPGLHRWQVDDAGRMQVMIDILQHNELAWGALLMLRRKSAFLMLRYGRLAHVFVDLAPPALDVMLRAPQADPVLTALDRVDLGQDGDALAQLLWVNADDHTVLTHFQAVRDLSGERRSTTSRGSIP